MQNKSKAASRELPKVVLSDHVKEIIVNEILSGALKPGDRVVENSLARRLGVSQAPVRDAIRDLVLLGFLKAAPYKGTTVRSFSQEDLNEVYLVRAALEALAARLAAARIKEADVKALRKILDKMIQAARKQNLQQTAKLSNQFHETILQIAGNSILYNVWKNMEFGYWTQVTARMSGHDLEAQAVRHEDLLAALMSRDPRKAKQAMQRHLEDLGNPVGDLPPDAD
ncbi:MAG: GntR family transcriptional regulator [Desulfobacterales bacterium]|nr:MAG: GntR family transcriptional regulator [Desulfobacterales bacterium]